MNTSERKSRRWAYQMKQEHYTLDWKNPAKKKYIALYGIFRQSPSPECKIEGYVENSFSMEWSYKFVLTMEYSMALKDLNEMFKLPVYKKDIKNGYRYFIYRITRKSKNAAIQATPPPIKYDKYNYRNWAFTVNSNINRSTT